MADSAVAMVKAKVTDLPVASGTRSAAAIISDTPVTRPPSDPDGAPALAMSLLVLTVMPVSLPAVAGPNVTPLSVTTCAPAAKLPSTRIEKDDTVGACTKRPVADPITVGFMPEGLMKFMG